MASLPDECFSDILACLDNRSLYSCLFVNRNYCKFTIPIIWRSPFAFDSNLKISLINSLLACLNESEISSLIPCIIDINNKSSLFEYGKFIRKINNDNLAKNIEIWLKYSNDEFDVDQDCRVQKLVNVLYNMILRQGSNIQEFDLIIPQYVDLPKFSVFTTYKPGITNLKTLYINLDTTESDTMRYENTIEFLRMVPKFCNSIINCYILIIESTIEFIELFVDVIKLQPLENMVLRISKEDNANKDLLYALEARSKTLKKLSFENINFQDIDLSFISNFEYLELLKFNQCRFTPKHFERLFKRKLHLNELILWYNAGLGSNIIRSMIDFFCDEELFKLSLNIITPETTKAVKEFCPRLGFLNIEISSEKHLESSILHICELSSLKTLHIQTKIKEKDLLVRILCICLISVEHLSLNFHVDLRSFEYFTDNCNANLKKLNILVSAKFQYLKDSYLKYVGNYQKTHNSLMVFRMNDRQFIIQ